MSNWPWLVLIVAIGAVWFLLWHIHRHQGADWGNPLLNVLDAIIRLFVRFYHRYQFQLPELPAQGGVLVVSNHVSGLDPFLIIAACRRPVRFLIAREQYQRFGLRWLFRAAGCIPVERHGGIEVSFRAAIRALRQGEVVALFPGGAIHPSHHPPPALKPGVFRLAKATDVPILPVCLSGIKGEGKVAMAVVIPSKARLVSYPVLRCEGLNEGYCLQQLAILLNKNHCQTK